MLGRRQTATQAGTNRGVFALHAVGIETDRSDVAVVVVVTPRHGVAIALHARPQLIGIIRSAVVLIGGQMSHLAVGGLHAVSRALSVPYWHAEGQHDALVIFVVLGLGLVGRHIDGDILEAADVHVLVDSEAVAILCLVIPVGSVGVVQINRQRLGCILRPEGLVGGNGVELLVTPGIVIIARGRSVVLQPILVIEELRHGHEVMLGEAITCEGDRAVVFIKLLGVVHPYRLANLGRQARQLGDGLGQVGGNSAEGIEITTDTQSHGVVFTRNQAAAV